MKKILILGSGFAGLMAARTLCRNKDLHITIIDEKNYYLFQPLLYQVALAALSPEDIAVPIRVLFARQPQVTVLKLKADSVDLRNKKVLAGGKEIPYDYLISACGSRHMYFGHPEWEAYAPGLKSLEQALEIRDRILEAFEKAETLDDQNLRRKLLTFVVVGGGPTGVELAGAIADISRHILIKNFRNIDPKKTRIILMEANPKLLPFFSKEMSNRAVLDLKALGVEVRTSSLVNKVDENGVITGQERIEAGLVLWAAGVQASELNKSLELDLDRQGRVSVEPNLSLQGYPKVFVIGDQARCLDRKTGNPLPALAAVALQQGACAARNILSDLKGTSRKDFRYHNRGNAATIGKSKAIVETAGLKLSGFFAWILWLLIHLFFLEGFKNRLIVVVKWAWVYLGHYDSARIILSKEWRFYPPKEDKPRP